MNSKRVKITMKQKMKVPWTAAPVPICERRPRKRGSARTDEEITRARERERSAYHRDRLLRDDARVRGEQGKGSVHPTVGRFEGAGGRAGGVGARTSIFCWASPRAARSFAWKSACMPALITPAPSPVSRRGVPVSAARRAL